MKPTLKRAPWVPSVACEVIRTSSGVVKDPLTRLVSVKVCNELSGKARTSRRPCKAAAPKRPHLHPHPQLLLREHEPLSHSRLRTHIPTQPVRPYVLSTRGYAAWRAFALHLTTLRGIVVSIPFTAEKSPPILVTPLKLSFYERGALVVQIFFR